MESLRQSELRLMRMNAELEHYVAQQTEEIRRTNRELMNALKELREIEQLRDTFVSALTHDLRTPLIGQKRALELLEHRRTELPGDLAELVERMHLGNNDLIHLVNQLLEMYHLESGQVELSLLPVSLYERVQLAVAEVTLLAEARKLTIVNEITADLTPVILDADQCHRVLMNLLGNAVKHLPVGATLWIRAAVSAGEVLMTFEDDGPGIPEELHEHLFSRYPSHQGRRQLGSGLGLYTCKLIMNLHGGDIALESLPAAAGDKPSGSRFVIRIPVNAAEQGGC